MTSISGWEFLDMFLRYVAIWWGRGVVCKCTVEEGVLWRVYFTYKMYLIWIQRNSFLLYKQVTICGSSGDIRSSSGVNHGCTRLIRGLPGLIWEPTGARPGSSGLIWFSPWFIRPNPGVIRGRPGLSGGRPGLIRVSRNIQDNLG